MGLSLIVGLGNPGAEYADTRHNAGFRFLDALAAAHGAALRGERRFQGRTGVMRVDGRELRLLAPDTFMNHSGEAVARLARYYKIPAQEILVVHDELDLPPGAVRVKLGGGDAGHNGLGDITTQLGTPDYYRLRIGIGRPASSAQVVNFVLKRASKAEQEQIDAAIARALDQLPEIVAGRMEKAMNALHAYKP